MRASGNSTACGAYGLECVKQRRLCVLPDLLNLEGYRGAGIGLELTFSQSHSPSCTFLRTGCCACPPQEACNSDAPPGNSALAKRLLIKDGAQSPLAPKHRDVRYSKGRTCSTARGPGPGLDLVHVRASPIARIVAIYKPPTALTARGARAYHPWMAGCSSPSSSPYASGWPW